MNHGRSKVIFEIESSYTNRDPATNNRHTRYVINVRKSGNSVDPHPVLIERRYNDFWDLYSALLVDHRGALRRVYFPPKVLVGRFDRETISERSDAFQVLLNHIARSDVKNARSFVDFLQAPELDQAKKLMRGGKYNEAIPILQNVFSLLNKLYPVRNIDILKSLCLLIACANELNLAYTANYVTIALSRFKSITDPELLTYFVPLLQLSKQLSLPDTDQQYIDEQLKHCKRCGVNIEPTGLSFIAFLLLDSIPAKNQICCSVTKETDLPIKNPSIARSNSSVITKFFQSIFPDTSAKDNKIAKSAVAHKPTANADKLADAISEVSDSDGKINEICVVKPSLAKDNKFSSVIKNNAAFTAYTGPFDSDTNEAFLAEADASMKNDVESSNNYRASIREDGCAVAITVGRHVTKFKKIHSIPSNIKSIGDVADYDVRKTSADVGSNIPKDLASTLAHIVSDNITFTTEELDTMKKEIDKTSDTRMFHGFGLSLVDSINSDVSENNQPNSSKDLVNTIGNVVSDDTTLAPEELSTAKSSKFRKSTQLATRKLSSGSKLNDKSVSAGIIDKVFDNAVALEIVDVIEPVGANTKVIDDSNISKTSNADVKTMSKMIPAKPKDGNVVTLNLPDVCAHVSSFSKSDTIACDNSVIMDKNRSSLDISDEKSGVIEFEDISHRENSSVSSNTNDSSISLAVECCAFADDVFVKETETGRIEDDIKKAVDDENNISVNQSADVGLLQLNDRLNAFIDDDNIFGDSQNDAENNILIPISASTNANTIPENIMKKCDPDLIIAGDDICLKVEKIAEHQ